jgi:tRNA-specific 2-thiouridylase
MTPEAVRPGDIVDEAGKVLGRHNGIIHYTVGQRKGLGIGGGAPLYVLRVDANADRVIVGPYSSLERTEIVIRDVNWLGDTESIMVHCQVKVRSTRPPQSATVTRNMTNGTALVVLDTPEYGVAAGQAFIKKIECLVAVGLLGLQARFVPNSIYFSFMILR